MSESKVVIPDEAVEAAARALWQTNQHDDEWVGEFPEYMDYLRAEATKALEAAAAHLENPAYRAGFGLAKDFCKTPSEAAAPHLIQAAKAAAWDEGYKTGLFDKEYYAMNPNPYR